MEFDLAQLREDAAESLDILFEDAFAEVLEEGTEEEITGLVREACVHFHTLGVTNLLLDGNPQYLFYNLGCAAENWRRVLFHLRGRGSVLPPASDNMPLLGAVAAEYTELARELCRLSATQRSDDEYEDEFAWAHLLQELIVLPNGEVFPLEQLQRHERVLEESQPDRLELFRALLAADERRFVDTFTRVQQRHEMETEAQAGGFGNSPERFVAYRFIWFEGLALLRLAERRGLRVTESWVYCPPLARVPMKMKYDGDWALPFGA